MTASPLKRLNADEQGADGELHLALREFRKAAAAIMQALGKRALAVGSAAP